MAVRRHVLWLVVASALLPVACSVSDDGTSRNSGTAAKSASDVAPSTAIAAPSGQEQQRGEKPEPCPDAADGSEEDLDREPSYSADYLHRWTNRRSCPVRLDVLMTRLVRDGACGPDDDIMIGTPLGTSHQVESPARIYGATEGAIDRDAQLPTSASPSGYRQGDYELWMVDADQSALFLVYPDHVERWGLAVPPLTACG